MIDPGHGGNDKGATIALQTASIKESDLTLSLSKKIVSLIQEKHSEKINVQVTRTKNQYVSLPQRLQSQEPIDLYLSLHYNSAFSEALSGTEIYFPQESKLPPSLSVLEAIKQDVMETGRIRKSLNFSHVLSPTWTSSKVKIRRAPFYILEKATSPAILVEVSYMTNPSEQKTLLQNQDQVALSIVTALLNFKELRDSTIDNDLN